MIFYILYIQRLEKERLGWSGGIEVLYKDSPGEHDNVNNIWLLCEKHEHFDLSVTNFNILKFSILQIFALGDKPHDSAVIP